MQTNSLDTETGFETINNGYNRTFQSGRLSIGVVAPLESYAVGALPDMKRDVERVQLAEELGFAAVWLRDVPFNVPSFGDAGQMYDPFVYLGLLAAQTERIALGVASIVLPLRHPAHIAKAAASVDVLSGGRLILGVASGDRPEEYPALNMSFEDRGERFRASFEYINRMWDDAPSFENFFGCINSGSQSPVSPEFAIDMLPKPMSGKVPLLITGGSQQDPEWIAANGEGWITYPRNVEAQSKIITAWRQRINDNGDADKPAVQSLYIDLVEDPDAPAEPIHLGFRSGVNHLRHYLTSLEEIGINHVALNLRFNQADIETTLRRLAKDLIPEFC